MARVSSIVFQVKLFLIRAVFAVVRVNILQQNRYTGAFNVWLRCVQLCSLRNKLCSLRINYVVLKIHYIVLRIKGVVLRINSFKAVVQLNFLFFKHLHFFFLFFLIYLFIDKQHTTLCDDFNGRCNSGAMACCYCVGVTLLTFDIVPSDRPWKSERRLLENHILVWLQFSTTLLLFYVYR